MGMRFTVYVHKTKGEGFFKGGGRIPEQGTERKERNTCNVNFSPWFMCKI